MENLLNRYPALEVCASDIQVALELMIDTYKNGGKSNGSLFKLIIFHIHHPLNYTQQNRQVFR